MNTTYQTATQTVILNAQTTASSLDFKYDLYQGRKNQVHNMEHVVINIFPTYTTGSKGNNIQISTSPLEFYSESYFVCVEPQSTNTFLPTDIISFTTGTVNSFVQDPTAGKRQQPCYGQRITLTYANGALGSGSSFVTWLTYN
jgi:hypothetical protein